MLRSVEVVDVFKAFQSAVRCGSTAIPLVIVINLQIIHLCEAVDGIAVSIHIVVGSAIHLLHPHSIPRHSDSIVSAVVHFAELLHHLCHFFLCNH